MNASRFVPVVAYLLGGMIAWAGAFAAAYGVAAVVCARGLGEEAVLGIALLPLSIGLVTLVALAAAGAVALAAYRRRPSAGEDGGLPAFVHTMALITALMAIVGIVWNAVPALFLATCA